jgi:hypothetical protein
MDDDAKNDWQREWGIDPSPPAFKPIGLQIISVFNPLSG